MKNTLYCSYSVISVIHNREITYHTQIFAKQIRDSHAQSRIFAMPRIWMPKIRHHNIRIRYFQFQNTCGLTVTLLYHRIAPRVILILFCLKEKMIPYVAVHRVQVTDFSMLRIPNGKSLSPPLSHMVFSLPKLPYENLIISDFAHNASVTWAISVS